MSFFTFNFEWGNQRTEILETEIGFATFFSFFSFLKKRRTDTNSAIPRGACFSVIVEYFRNKYRDNLAFYFKEKIYGS